MGWLIHPPSLRRIELHRLLVNQRRLLCLRVSRARIDVATRHAVGAVGDLKNALLVRIVTDLEAAAVRIVHHGRYAHVQVGSSVVYIGNHLRTIIVQARLKITVLLIDDRLLRRASRLCSDMYILNWVVDHLLSIDLR